MASLTISVPETLRDWVESRVETGVYADAGDYLRDLIRRDRAETAENTALAAALAEGEASGVSERQAPDILAALRQATRAVADFSKIEG
jgi:antitoxin ParD1/3/4